MSLGNKDTLKYIKPNDVCVEVGVWKGDLSRQIVQTKAQKIYLIDPWKSIDDFPGRLHNTEQKILDDIYKKVRRRFSFDNRVRVIRKFSTEACLGFENESIDWIYIDGNHSYEFVKEDLNNWWPKIKPGGFMCGDDYIDGKYQVENLNFGIIPAVDEFREKNKSNIDFFELIKDQFVIKKNDKP